MNWLLTRILWGKQGKWKLLVAGLGFLAGLLIILIGLQVFLDVRHVVSPDKSNVYEDYLIISKNITLANTLQTQESYFNKQEVEKISKQPFVEKVGVFQSNQFEATLSAQRRIQFSTLIFFESVPDEFLDFEPVDWDWNPQSKFVPIIISQDFLDLYNFGFALSRGLPQLSRHAISLVPFRIKIRGPGGDRHYDAEVIGLSNRISSILVPQTFMQWANDTIAQKKDTKPSRLIIKVSNPADPKIAEYLDDNSLQTNKEKLKSSSAAGLIKAAISLIGTLGGLFLLLSILIFAMNFRVIIAESKNEIKLLIDLGYRLSTVAWHLIFFFKIFLVVVAAFTWVALDKVVFWMQEFLIDRQINIRYGIDPIVLYVGVSLLIFSLLANIFSVYSLLKKALKIR